MSKAPDAQHAKEVVVELRTWTTPSYAQRVVGKRSAFSDNLDEFRGIPFGEVTKRWEHAKLRPCLPHDMFDATKDGPKCIQSSGADNSEYFQAQVTFPQLPESEFDCLNLLIIRPSVPGLSRVGFEESAKLPVLVWIHGGGGGSGAGSDPIVDPARLVLRSLGIGSPIIAVNLNYRLNMFGFLGSSDILDAQDQSEIRGLNFATYDQKVGLAWIARNITHFGGDPEHITLGGQSSGSHSVHAHILDAEAQRTERPLFQKALMQSGAQSTVSPGALEDVNVHWDKLCKHWGVNPQSSSRDKVQSLRRVPPIDLLDSALKNQVFLIPLIADNVTFTLDTVNLPHVGLRRGPKPADYKPIEIMIGASEVKSAGHFQGDVDLCRLQKIFGQSYPTVEAGARVLEAYGLVDGADQPSMQEGLEQFRSDAVFHLSIHRTRVALSAQRRREYGDATSIQPYHIEFGNPFPGTKQGYAHHGVELIYQFDAFHDALVDADKGVFKPYRVAGPYVLPAGQDAESPPTKTPTDTRTHAPSHVDLVRKFQDHWIGFIVGKPVQKVADVWNTPLNITTSKALPKSMMLLGSLLVSLLLRTCFSAKGQSHTAPAVHDNDVSTKLAAHLLDKHNTTIRGKITTRAPPSGVGIIVHVTLWNLHPKQSWEYHIHEKPVPDNGDCWATGKHLDPYGRTDTPPCDIKNPVSCEVGDLSGKHAPAFVGYSGTFDVRYTDFFLSNTPGTPAYYGNRSVVVHAPDGSRVNCGNFEEGGLFL
ncbi:Alpha/Beta hydrolase protein [Aspergillus floccosus]